VELAPEAQWIVKVKVKVHRHFIRQSVSHAPMIHTLVDFLVRDFLLVPNSRNY